MIETDDYVAFYGKRDIYSNFYPCEFVHDGHTFNCSEQCFMYLKAMHFNDPDIAWKILITRSPFDQKQLGKQVRGFTEQAWAKVRKQAMVTACYAKFSQNDLLGRALLLTKNKLLIEASRSDTIWGVGLNEYDPSVGNPEQWRGMNLLGESLMEVRQRLSDE